MKFNTKQIKYKNIDQIFEKYTKAPSIEERDNLLFLYDLVDYFRPNKPKKVDHISLQELIDYLIINESERNILAKYLYLVLKNRTFHRMVSDAGILKDSDFIYEVKKRLFDKILPYQPQKDSLEYVLNQIFYKETDFVWINKIPYNELLELFTVLNLEHMFTKPFQQKSTLSEILFAIGLITQRMSGRAMESNIIDMVPEYTHLESPFLGLENEFLFIEKAIRNKEITCLDPDSLNYKQLIILHKQCLDFVNQAFKNSSKYGITLKVNQGLLRIRQQLLRVEILIKLLATRDEEDKINKTILLTLKLIEYNCYKNNVSTLISESTQLISYEITQYTAKTGEHYITESSRDYFKMFKAAAGAGIVVGFMCITKVLLYKTNTSSFGLAFLSSMNYSLGFILIYLCGYTLATKQPAMTATTIIKAIEEGLKNTPDKNKAVENKHRAFANLFARLFRSQFIAFVGNVIFAFPVALLIMWLFDYTTGINLTDTKWPTMLKDASPWHSPAIFHASIAGVYLFLSGIISGNVSNKNKHNQVYYRIKENPVIKKTIGKENAVKTADWLEKKWPGIVSNFWFGIFMGSTVQIGHFLGLNLDIRHITFVSGNIAMAAYGADFQLTLTTWFWCFMGLFFVGLMNFLVSFSLSLGLAFRSRNIPPSEIFALNKSVWKHFKKHPLQFFFPIKEKAIE